MSNNRALDHKCPTCGAPIKFIPSLGKWKCNYCDNEYTLEQMQKYNNASSKENNKNDGESVNLSTYLCKNCGAEIIADELTTATFCIYCGNTAILKNKLTGKFAPSKLIPFKKEKEDAIRAFKNISKGRPLMPKLFNDLNNIEKIKGVYIPFWLFDIDVEGTLNASGNKVRTWRVGNTMYTKTDNYRFYRTGSMKYNYIPVDGSSHFENDIMNTLEPFNYNELTDYNHAYLSGFLAEKYDISDENAYNIAKGRALTSTKDVMLNTIGNYSSKRVIENTLKDKIENKEYALLPVWMVNVKYKDKMYTFAMNGQTGKFIGNIPIDKKKTIIWSITMFTIIFLGIILISYIAYLFGGNV